MAAKEGVRGGHGASGRREAVRPSVFQACASKVSRRRCTFLRASLCCQIRLPPKVVVSTGRRRNVLAGGCDGDGSPRAAGAGEKDQDDTEQQEEQRRSFAYGNTKIENDRITREMIDEAAERIARERR